MKKYSFVTILFVIFVSCGKESSDLLDPETAGISETDVFTDARNAMLFLNDIYGDIVPVIPQTGNKGMRWPGSDAMLEITTDNGSTNLGSGSFTLFNQGAWTPLSSNFATTEWSNNWVSIRACNLFLSHVDDIPLNAEYNFDNQTRDIRKGECLFLMAFFYEEMLKLFGGLPIIDKAYTITEEMNFPRATFDETVDFITGLCDQASELLPVEHPDADYGRATKGAALALKARVLLYAASPLWNNPQKTEDSPFRGRYDSQKWIKAAQAANVVIGMNKYWLHPDISDLFLTRVNPELIFVHMNQPCSWMTSISIPTPLCPAGRSNKSGCNQVTYNLIKEYEILNGGQAYSIGDPLSGYDDQSPYINRDPRFYRDCMFNGSAYQGKTAQFGEADAGVSKPEHNPLETSPLYTHVYSIKFADLTLILNFDARNPAAGQRANQNYPYLRYAEILLNYAEAMNEAYGPETDGLGNGKTALWAVNEVRTRAQYPALPEYLGNTGGMPPIPSGLTREVMREKIRHERRIELAFEEHRFYDVRRWMLEPSTLTGIQAQIPVWQIDGTARYEIRTIENRVFNRNMYRMPIPEQQIYNNPNLIQNPGWNFSPENAD
ncbi:MAG: RagB/SusD family nutrient uptake outer membrane protein [Bacteroidales bacterium]|jgi:hypothetical protein|nr:RagB/SusD family nutrient uptake outer membrane protein [Bacteroidales bacterium]